MSDIKIKFLDNKNIISDNFVISNYKKIYDIENIEKYIDSNKLLETESNDLDHIIINSDLFNENISQSFIDNCYFIKDDGIYINCDYYENNVLGYTKNNKLYKNQNFNYIINNSKKYCFIHSCILHGKVDYCIHILNNLVFNLTSSDLYDYLKLIFIINIGSPIEEDYYSDKKIKIINFSEDNSLNELKTLNLIHSFCELNEDSQILYIHTKGISYINNNNMTKFSYDWKNMMLYFLIEKFNDCFDLLKKNDVIGCNYFISPKKHFSGNYWWANSNYVKNNLSKIYGTNKMDAEMWILSSNNVKFHNLYHSNINHFHSEYPISKYFIREDNNVEKIYRVKMICNWCSSEQLCNDWSNMCEKNFNWKNIEITWDNNIDYYVIINKPCNDEFYDAERTIIFQMEPWVYNSNIDWGVKSWGDWAIPDENKFLAVRGRKTEHHNNAFWQLELKLRELEKMEFKKTKLISSICSSKYTDEGHIVRINLLRYIESKNDIIIDIYNSNNDMDFKNYRGEVMPHIDKSRGMVPYKYYFMIENNFERNFITEKIWEPILCESLVFYYGCPNVDDYINPLAYVLLDINDFEKSYQIIKTAIEEDLWSKRIDIIREEKRRILNEYAFFPVVQKIIEQDVLKKDL
jgi:hypothetical protein